VTPSKPLSPKAAKVCERLLLDKHLDLANSSIRSDRIGTVGLKYVADRELM
jgi:hypothetical protein